MAKQETAEQKLLKMIEVSSVGDSESVKTHSKVTRKESALSLTKKINFVLIFGVVVAAIFLVKEVIAGTEYLTKGVQFKVDQNAMTRNRKSEIIMPSVPRLSVYLAGVSQRNIFQPFEPADVKTATNAVEKNGHITQKAATLRLVGVSWLDTVDSASVMIEDTEKKVTYFLKKGEKLGDIFVKTIYADSAVLGYENEEMTIKYDKSQM